MFGSYERASIKDYFAFYGIEKACRGVVISHLECREKGAFSIVEQNFKCDI